MGKPPAGFLWAGGMRFVFYFSVLDIKANNLREVELSQQPAGGSNRAHARGRFRPQWLCAGRAP